MAKASAATASKKPKAEKPVEIAEQATPAIETIEASSSAAPKQALPQEIKKAAEKFSPEYDVHQLLESGAHFGHQAKRWHPKMAPYIYAKRDGVHIFDLIITANQLKKAAEFAYSLGKEGKSLVFVGTKRQAKDIVREEAIQSGAMYIVNRWLGGFISNWEQVSRSNKEMISIRKGLEEGRYKNYTKKERLLLEKKIQRLERFFGGVVELKNKPDAMFIIDVGREKTAILEATEAGIPLIGFVDSNNDPTPIDYVIPANDDAARSIKFIVHAIAEAYKAGKAAR